jgi:hypothetical protein
MKLEITGLTRAEELAWLMELPWTFVSINTTMAPDEYEVRVQEMPDALVIGTEPDVSRDIWDALRASLECRLDHDDPIPLPRAVFVEQKPILLWEPAAAHPEP